MLINTVKFFFIYSVNVNELIIFLINKVWENSAVCVCTGKILKTPLLRNGKNIKLCSVYAEMLLN